MSVIETEIRMLRQELRQELKELRQLIAGRNMAIMGNYVKQDVACTMLNIKARRLADIRIHIDKDGKKVGCIRWRKGAGRTVEYHKADLEKYLSKITIG
jgi:hypothetical protein